MIELITGVCFVVVGLYLKFRTPSVNDMYSLMDNLQSLQQQAGSQERIAAARELTKHHFRHEKYAYICLVVGVVAGVIGVVRLFF